MLLALVQLDSKMVFDAADMLLDVKNEREKAIIKKIVLSLCGHHNITHML